MVLWIVVPARPSIFTSQRVNDRLDTMVTHPGLYPRAGRDVSLPCGCWSMTWNCIANGITPKAD